MAETDTALADFLREFAIAKTRIEIFTAAERLDNWIAGRRHQRFRWEAMGHRFVMSGLDAMITTGKDDASRPIQPD